MATSTYPTMTGAQTTTTQAVFIPEQWSSEIRAAFESNLVAANLVKTLDFSGQRGDTIHIPAPTRSSANAKAAATAVTIENNTESEVQVSIDQHYQYSRLLEDIASVQGLETQKGFYVEDSAYALSKQIDTSLLALAKSLGNGNGSSYVNTGVYYNDASSGLTAYAADTVAAADVFADSALRDLLQKQDDVDVPYSNRAFIVPPSLKNEIMGVTRYSSRDFVNFTPVQNGQIAELYGVGVFVSSNCPVVEAAGDNSANSGDVKLASLIHQDTYILAMQQNIRTQTQYKQEYLADLMTSDVLYGVKAYRPDSGFGLVVNA